MAKMKVRPVWHLVKHSELCDKKTGKLLYPKDFLVRAYVYYDLCVMLGRANTAYLYNKVKKEKKVLDALIPEYFPGKRRSYLVKKEIHTRRLLLYEKAMLNLEESKQVA